MSAQDLQRNLINRYCPLIAKLLIVATWLSNAVLRMVMVSDGCEATANETIQANAFFIPLAIAILIWSLHKIDNVFEFTFMEFALYNVIEEIVQSGSTVDIWEIVFFFAALLIAYLKFSGLGSHFIKILKQKW